MEVNLHSLALAFKADETHDDTSEISADDIDEDATSAVADAQTDGTYIMKESTDVRIFNLSTNSLFVPILNLMFRCLAYERTFSV
jgi:hypothetical protein